MEEIIRRIIEIEYAAQNLVAKGHAQAEKIRMDTLEKLKELENNITEMSSHKIEELRQKIRSEAYEKIQKISETTDKRLKALEAYVNENRETWENQIFNRILGR
ncbi:MAG: hypothetical protein GX022_09365 [Clostridiaceae bacterium]|nr:hypothetical protein [Clostridiaceae bacterium]